MRCTQLIGLHKKARDFLLENAVRKDPCEHCKRDSGYVRREGASIGFDDEHLGEYALKNGRIAKEFVQHEVWSSGPMIWLGLDIEGEKILWPENEIEED